MFAVSIRFENKSSWSEVMPVIIPVVPYSPCAIRNSPINESPSTFR